MYYVEEYNGSFRELTDQRTFNSIYNAFAYFDDLIWLMEASAVVKDERGRIRASSDNPGSKWITQSEKR